MRRVRRITVIIVLAAVVSTMAVGLVIAADIDRLDVADQHQSTERVLTASADLGTAAGATEATLSVEHEHRTVVATIENATPAERATITEAYLDQSERALADLADAEASATQALVDGSISRDAFVHNATVRGAEAAARQTTLERLGTLDGTVRGMDLQAESTQAAMRFDLLTGPVRDAMVSATAHPDDRMSVVAEGSEVGLRLTGVAGDRVHSDAIRFDRMPGDVDNLGGLTDAEAIAIETYPMSTETTALRHLGGAHYVVDRTLPGGTVRAHISGTDEAVVGEGTYRWLDTLEVASMATETELGITVTVERTGDGALRINSVDADTGEPVEATAYIRHSGTWSLIGPLDDTGDRWVADPGDTVEIRLVTDAGTITVTADG